MHKDTSSLGKVISREGVQPRPKRGCMCTNRNVLLNNRKRITFIFRYNELPRKVFNLCICRGKSTTAGCSHHGICNWTWNSMYQFSNDRAKSIIKKNATMMAFYNEKQQLYSKRDVSGVSLWASLLQVRHRMGFPRNEAPYNAMLWAIAFASKKLNKYRILLQQHRKRSTRHGLEKCYHYCFGHEIIMIADHKLLVAILRKILLSYDTGFKEYH